MDDPWGLDDPPATLATEPLPPRLAALLAVRTRQPWDDRRFPHPRELPEVAALERQGWYAFDDAPYHLCLPAVWPRAHRWVRDRLPKVSFGNDTVEPWSTADVARMAAHYGEVARECGLPPPPPGRLWLVRSPWPGQTVPDLFAAFERGLAERGLRPTTACLTDVAREVLAREYG